MQGAVISLARFGVRLVAGALVALLLALLVALVRDDGSFAASLRIGVLAVGSVTLLLAFGGNSPGRRLAADHYAAHLFPKLHRQSGAPYGGHVLSDSAIFALVGIALIAVGFALPA